MLPPPANQLTIMKLYILYIKRIYMYFTFIHIYIYNVRETGRIYNNYYEKIIIYYQEASFNCFLEFHYHLHLYHNKSNYCDMRIWYNYKI